MKVLETTNVREKKIAVVEVLEGEPMSNDILRSEKHGSEWKVSGSAFVPAKTWSEQNRGLLLESVDGTKELEIAIPSPKCWLKICFLILFLLAF